MRVSLTLAIQRDARYCSFVDSVSDIVNESIRPDLIVGRNKARRDARVLPTRSSVGTSRAASHKSEMCQRPAMCRDRWQSHWIIRDEKLFWYAAGGYLAEALNIPFSFDTFSGCALSLHVNYKIPWFASASRYISDVFIHIALPVMSFIGRMQRVDIWQRH